MVQIVGKEVATTVHDLVSALTLTKYPPPRTVSTQTPAGLGFARDRLMLGDMLATEMTAYDRGCRPWSGAQDNYCPTG
ncbi:hypothetical protein ARSEF4850_009018 [Beauveria asiatica]